MWNGISTIFPKNWSSGDFIKIIYTSYRYWTPSARKNKSLCRYRWEVWKYCWSKGNFFLDTFYMLICNRMERLTHDDCSLMSNNSIIVPPLSCHFCSFAIKFVQLALLQSFASRRNLETSFWFREFFRNRSNLWGNNRNYCSRRVRLDASLSLSCFLRCQNPNQFFKFCRFLEN